jgi:hypothetical protein
MIFFGILVAIDAVIAFIALYFFAIGLADGSVSSFNIVLWLGILGSITAVMIGGLVSNAKGHRRLADAVLMILALPGVLFALFMLFLIVSHPRWN